MIRIILADLVIAINYAATFIFIDNPSSGYN